MGTRGHQSRDCSLLAAAKLFVPHSIPHKLNFITFAYVCSSQMKRVSPLKAGGELGTVLGGKRASVGAG
jgi:hypothetical protein